MWKLHWGALIVCLSVPCVCGCAGWEVKNNAAVCRIAFDYNDPALQTLNPHNARALLAFSELCRKGL